ncbi:MAG: hypothetical protein MUO40_07975 [Anaerolineaceae bacterium]|nr:hypothetical protein [Anaerolineaceae bacterium]
MKKAEALDLMAQGKRITHPKFTAEEWISIRDNQILTEDGIKHNPLQFWARRTDSGFNDGYYLHFSNAAVAAEQNLTIKITGGGTRNDIAKALFAIAREILSAPVEELDGCEWEDCTLMTEVNAGDDDLDECTCCGAGIPDGSLYCPNCGDENF